MGRMGKEFVAANSINSVVMQFASVALMGTSSAAAAIIGNTIGATANTTGPGSVPAP